MKLSEIFSPELTFYCKNGINSKKKALEKISKLISSQQDVDVKYQYILDSLQMREKIGSTALGYGVAIPHARVKGILKPTCAVLSLKTPINFSTSEEKMVDLIFGLIVPEDYVEEHLQLLAGITEKLRESEFRDSLRSCDESQLLYQRLKGYDGKE